MQTPLTSAFVLPSLVDTPESRRQFRLLVGIPATLLVVLTLPFVRSTSGWQSAVIIAGALVFPLASARRLDPWWDRYGEFVAVAGVTLAVVLTGGGRSPYLVLYALGPLYGAIFYEVRRLVVDIVVVVGALIAVAALTSGIPGPRLVELLIQIGVFLLVVMIVQTLVRRFREAADGLALTEQRYRSLVENNPDAVHLFDLDGTFLRANPAALAMTGHTFDEVRAAGRQRFDALVAPDCRERSWSAFRRTAAGKPEHFETAILAKDGRRVELQVATVPVTIADEVVGVFSVSKDITRQRHAERRLQERATQQATVAAFAHRALDESDLDLLLEEAVRVVTRTLGAPLCGVFRRQGDCAVLVAGAGWEPGQVGTASLACEPGSLFAMAVGQVDPVFGLPAGRLPDLLAAHGAQGGISVLIGRPSQPVGVLGVYTTHGSFSRDDASFVQTVASLLASAHQRRESHQRLLQVQRLDALGQLAGGIAHDFNNLLTALLGYQELAIESLPPDGVVAGHLTSAIEAARRAKVLVAQLLTFNAEQQASDAPAILDQVVEDMTGLLEGLLPDHVGLELELSAGRVAVGTHPHQLEQVVLNLAVNARDAMPDGGRLRVCTRVEGPFAVLEVADSGTGMPPEVVARLFEPFFTTKPPGEGTGLGLPTVAQLVEGAGGKVEIASEPGAGSSFAVTLPIVTVRPEMAIADRTPQVALAGQETVLVVEDQAAVRALVAEVLRQQGFSVLEARNGVEALTVLARRQEAIDLLVTDVAMPQLDGPSLARELRQDRPDLKVLYTSGYSADPTAADPRASAFLPKPFGVAELLAAVEKLRQSSRGIEEGVG